MLLHISAEKIPDEQDIRRLTQTLKFLRYSGTIKQDFVPDGISILGRGPRRA